MKKLINSKDVKTLSKKEQKQIFGGFGSTIPSGYGTCPYMIDNNGMQMYIITPCHQTCRDGSKPVCEIQFPPKEELRLG